MSSPSQEIEQTVFRELHRCRDGQLDRDALLEALRPTQEQLRDLQEEGLKRGQTGPFCRDLLNPWPAFWTFCLGFLETKTLGSFESAEGPAICPLSGRTW